MSGFFFLITIAVVHFVAAATPGPSTLLVTQTSITASRRAGLLTAFGTASATAAWSISAVLGLSLVLLNLAWLYDALKLAGGVYLIYVGIRMWREAPLPLPLPSQGVAGVRASDARAYVNGLVTNLANPKSAFYYVSIFAVLLPPELPIWVRGASVAVVVAVSLTWYSVVATLLSAMPAQRAYARVKTWLDRVAGAVFIAFGLRLAFPDR